MSKHHSQNNVSNHRAGVLRELSRQAAARSHGNALREEAREVQWQALSPLGRLGWSIQFAAVQTYHAQVAQARRPPHV